MTWADDLQDAAAAIVDLAGETVLFTGETVAYEVSAVFRSLSMDDMAGDHLMSDMVVCQVLGADLEDGDPRRGHTITRNPDSIDPTTLEIMDMRLDPSGLWEFVCRTNIRVTP